jgi:hypothetical protein
LLEFSYPKIGSVTRPSRPFASSSFHHGATDRHHRATVA